MTTEKSKTLKFRKITDMSLDEIEKEMGERKRAIESLETNEFNSNDTEVKRSAIILASILNDRFIKLNEQKIALLRHQLHCSTSFARKDTP